MFRSSLVRSTTLIAALWLAPLTVYAQGAPPAAKPAAKPAAGKDATKPADAKPGDGKDPSAVAGDATDATTTPAEGDGKVVEPPPDGGQPAADDDDDDDDDLWGDAETDGDEAYVSTDVQADFSQPQPAGYDHEPHHDHRWVYHNLFAVRVNPLGLTNRFRTGYQMQLSHKPEPIFHESHASLQLDTEITPSFGYVGGRLEIQPVKLLSFWASYGVVGTFGTFNYTTSFADAQAEHSDDDLDVFDRDCVAGSDPCQYTTYGNKAVLSGLFQVGIGGVVIRDNAKATWMSMKLTDGDQVFWDATLDVLYPNSGWVVTNDADLLFITDWDWPGDLIVGLRHTVTKAIYRSEHLAGGKDINSPTHRIGPALLYKFFEDDPGADFNSPTLILLTQWWAKHRYRTSQSPALPYLVIGFAMQGDLMVSAKE